MFSCLQAWLEIVQNTLSAQVQPLIFVVHSYSTKMFLCNGEKHFLLSLLVISIFASNQSPLPQWLFNVVISLPNNIFWKICWCYSFLLYTNYPRLTDHPASRFILLRSVCKCFVCWGINYLLKISPFVTDVVICLRCIDFLKML